MKKLTLIFTLFFIACFGCFAIGELTEIHIGNYERMYEFETTVPKIRVSYSEFTESILQ